MITVTEQYFITEHKHLFSKKLKRDVKVDFFLPKDIVDTAQMSLLLINDGQDMPIMHFADILHNLYDHKSIAPLLCVAIRASENRMMEYGVAKTKDFMGRGAKAASYSNFILKELLPFIKQNYNIPVFKETAFAGFSLGGLSALDIAWQHPDIFSKVGVFSASLWWRSKSQDDKNYCDDKHRIMLQQIRRTKGKPDLKFFFQCGRQDELNDRNDNGIPDSVEDTLDTFHELIKKDYPFKNLAYIEFEDGKHDVPTWGRAIPLFLKWGWGI